MEKTLAEIAEIIGGTIVGNKTVKIRGFAGLKEAKPGDLSFLANPKYTSLLKETKASAVLVSENADVQTDRTVIKIDNPSLAFSKIMASFVEKLDAVKGIHPTAVIASTAKLGKDVSVGPCVVIEDGAQVGDRTVVGAGSFIGSKAQIGQDCQICPNVSIREKVLIGERVTIHNGTVVGSDGFGFVAEQGALEKIPQIGIVEIQDDVEIGANVAIDRARFDKTVIGAGTKIDNLVQVAHNVRIGKNCIIVSQVGIAGSTIVEDNVVLGGQVGLSGHITVGEGTMIAAQSGVLDSVAPRSILFGSPALPHMQTKRIHAAMKKLPESLRLIRDLQARVEDLEKKLDKKS